MSLRLVLTFLLLSAAAAAQQAQTPKQAKIQRLFALTNQQLDFPQLQDQMKALVDSPSMPKLPPDAREKAEEMQKKTIESMQRFLTSEKMRAIQVKAYDEVYSSEEIDGMLAFYESPAGTAMLKKAPALQQKFMTGMQSLLLEHLEELSRITKESLPK